MAVRKNYTVNWEAGLYLREEPTKDSMPLAVLPYGTKVVVNPKEKTPEGWLAVESGGYVMKEYLK